MKKVKAVSIVLDHSVYPRMNLDAKNIRDITEALSLGVELPPVVIDAKSKRCVDGFHRVKANLRLYGDNAEVVVIEKHYKTEADLFLDAMRLNASHGVKLDSYDQTRCLLVADALGIKDEQLTSVLHLSHDKLDKLRVSRTAKNGKLNVPIKRTISHMAGRRLTKRQRIANERLSGMNQVFYANQLMELLESGMIDKDDEKLMARLAELRDAIDGVLVVV